MCLCFISPAEVTSCFEVVAVSDLPLEPQIKSTWFSALNTVSAQQMLVKLNWKGVLPWITATFAIRCTASAFTNGAWHQILLWEVSPVFPCVCTYRDVVRLNSSSRVNNKVFFHLIPQERNNVSSQQRNMNSVKNVVWCEWSIACGDVEFLKMIW